MRLTKKIVFNLSYVLLKEEATPNLSKDHLALYDDQDYIGLHFFNPGNKRSHFNLSIYFLKLLDKLNFIQHPKKLLHIKL